MIIDTKGNIVQIWQRKDGNVIVDSENDYGVTFGIVIPYTEEQKKLFSEIKQLKELLADSDYKALKYADGAYSEKEYAPIRKERAGWRARINEIEQIFQEPTLTRKEIDEAERLCFEKLKKKEAEYANSKFANSTNSN